MARMGQGMPKNWQTPLPSRPLASKVVPLAGIRVSGASCAARHGKAARIAPSLTQHGDASESRSECNPKTSFEVVELLPGT